MSEESSPNFPRDVAQGQSGSITISSSSSRPGAGMTEPAPVATGNGHGPLRRRRRTSLAARGEPMVWLTGGAVATCVLMIASLLLFIAWQGTVTFWPLPLVQLQLADGSTILGEPTRRDPSVDRTLYRIGNYDITGERFRWVNDDQIVSRSRPEWGLVVERTEWGNAYGTLESLTIGDHTYDDPEAAWLKFEQIHDAVREAAHGGASVNEGLAGARMTLRTPQGQIIPANRAAPDEPMLVSQVVRAYPPNQLDWFGRAQVYFSRWWEYLSDDPREANTEGGVFPAIVGTVMLTFVMILFVVPIGVIAALYLREYAKQGLLVSIVRISVNNLAGVPSIVYGVFGLGFFCYILGAGLDQLFFSERLPDPTLGKSAMIWASLTLALLTLPVVIVATEEALAAVPRSMREGSYACGASKWQTIKRIVLPRALPGIMTGTILALARGAGEVAPIMLVGAVKLAPKLPISAEGPLFGLNRSFMHLGFHIYDLGFQSPDSESARSMVYTTTMLLILIVVVLNVAAIFIRSRLRRAYSGGHF